MNLRLEKDALNEEKAQKFIDETTIDFAECDNEAPKTSILNNLITLSKVTP